MLVLDVVVVFCLSDLLNVEKCSSGKARERTSCSINRVVMGSVSQRCLQCHLLHSDVVVHYVH